jgi:nitrogen fixation/metabolism regulation signal transduction histidine kinase
MNSDLSLTNVSFGFLRNSSDFLNIILNNINSCVLLLDKQIRLRAFNDALKTIFSNKKDEDLQYMRCGEAIGCAYQIEEQKDCGKTSKCCDCELRIAAISSYMDNEIIYKDHITRPFFNYSKKKVDKHLQFSTRLFPFENEKYIIMIIEDITKFIEAGKNNCTD